MKPKINRKGEDGKVSGYDVCLTPPYALDALYQYLPKTATIWESAVGEGHLQKALIDRGYETIGTDLSQGEQYNFFEHEPSEWWRIQVTNPPYSMKFKWMKRSYELGRPFALLLPVEAIGASTAQDMMKKYGYEIMLLDSRVDFSMPNKGWEGAGAQFPVLWYCWKLLPRNVVFGSIKEAKKKWKKEFLATLPVEPEEKDEV